MAKAGEWVRAGEKDDNSVGGTVADVGRAVSDYEWRWPVAEEYHEVEKSG